MTELDTIRVSVVVPADRERTWRAVTEPVEMRQWFFDNIPAFEARKGFATAFDVRSGERVFPHRWTILDAAPPERIVYDWWYEGYAGRSRMTMTLTEAGAGQTRVQVDHEVLSPFDTRIPEFQPDSCRAGWRFFLDRLARYLSEAGR